MTAKKTLTIPDSEVLTDEDVAAFIRDANERIDRLVKRLDDHLSTCPGAEPGTS